MIGYLVLSIISINDTNYDYNSLINEAYNCRNATEKNLQTGIIEMLTEIEHFYFATHDIPEDLRGMLLAAACVESGYNAKAKGDWKIVFKT